MGMLDTLLRQQALKQEARGQIGPAITSLSNKVAKVAGVDKASKMKEAGLKLAALGGPSERNLKIVSKIYDLGPEEMNELLASFQTFSLFLKRRRMEQPLPEQTLSDLREKTGVPIPPGASMLEVVEMLKVFPKKGQPPVEPVYNPEKGTVRYQTKEPGKELAPGEYPASILSVVEQAKARKEKERQTEESKKTKEKETVRKSLEKAIQNYEKAMLGTNQFLPSEYNKKVAEQEHKRILTLAQRYAALGGRLEDLGAETLGTLEKWQKGESEEEAGFSSKPTTPQEPPEETFWQRIFK